LIGAAVIIGFTGWFFWPAGSSAIETLLGFVRLFRRG
jgi:hypothetical protein